MLLSELSRSFLVLSLVSFVRVRDFSDEGVVGIRIGEQAGDREQHLRYGERRAPVVLEYVETDAASAAYVRVVDLCLEHDLWRLERIISREVDRQEEQPVVVRRLGWPFDCRLPVVDVLTCGACRAS